MAREVCSWCGVDVDLDDGFRLAEPVGERRAVFCRLEHVVPWVIQGAHWEAGRLLGPGEPDDGLGRCAHCGGDLGDRRIADAFCGTDHLLAWAKAGGRWQRAS